MHFVPRPDLCIIPNAKVLFLTSWPNFIFFILEEYWIRHKVIYHSTLKVEQENQDKKGELQDEDDKGVVWQMG